MGMQLHVRGGKFDKASYMAEEVMRVPLAMSYKGRIKPKQVTDALVSNLDIPITILAAAGLSFDYEPDGKDLLELEASGFKKRRKFLVSETYGHIERNVAKSLVTSRYKYTVNKEDIAELYDLALDPYETKNLIFSEKYLPLKNKLDKMLRDWVKDEKDNFFDGDSEYILQEYLSKGTNKPRDY